MKRYRYRIAHQDLYTGLCYHDNEMIFESREKAQMMADILNEHLTNREYWVEKIPVDPPAGMVVGAVVCAAIWGIIGTLVGRTWGAAVGVVFGGVIYLFMYCLFGAGTNGPVEADRVDRTNWTNRPGPGRRAA